MGNIFMYDNGERTFFFFQSTDVKHLSFICLRMDCKLILFNPTQLFGLLKNNLQVGKVVHFIL